MELIDVGANLAHRSFSGDLPAVLARARAAGVVQIVVTGTSLATSEAASRLAATGPGLLSSTAGVHPHNAREWGPGSAAQLARLLERPGVVAVGECGLDFNRDFSPRPDQERCFEEQVVLACERGLPLFLHERDAHEAFLRILDRHHSQRMPPAVVHCFTGTETHLDAYLDRGFHIGVTGWICDERRGRHLRGLVGKIPAGRLLLETDAPFLTPRDLSPPPPRGRNEPAFLPHVAHAVADCLGVDVERLAASTTAAARAFFRLPG